MEAQAENPLQIIFIQACRKFIMKVVIFDTEHFEVTFAVIRFFDNGKNDITIYIFEKSYHQLIYLLKADAEKYTWVVKNETVSKYRFMVRLYEGVSKNRPDLLYLNTVPDNFIFYAFLVRLLPKT